jgi:hypothetical protein
MKMSVTIKSFTQENILYISKSYSPFLIEV